ncbi:MAG: thermonuclease family protein [Devosiaceae bacterium]|nr:thermonuclease family protein [Devosiaceae bacterium]
MKLRFLRFLRKTSQILNLILLFGFLAFALALSGYFFPQSNSVLSGRGHAADGDSIRIGDQRVRLLGIDAPELDQICLNDKGASWSCGERSKQRLAQLLSSGNVLCNFEARDKFGRALSLCKVGNRDVGAILVREGLAVSYNDYPREEAIARASRLGIWSGEFISPRDWRDGVRQSSSDQNMFDWFWSWLAR